MSKQPPGPYNFYNVRNYGAQGDGVTDDTPACRLVEAAIAAAGGGTYYFPAGNYYTNAILPPSNCIVQGDGIDATTITNFGSPNGETLIVAWTMSGGAGNVNWPTANTTYAINTPSNYTNQVTCTTHSQAGNFNSSVWAMVSGGLQSTSFWFPSWWTKVVSANASTGVVTLAEEIPFEGALLNTIQVVTAVPKNIIVRDMTLVAGLDSCVSVFGVDNMLIENCKFLPWPAGGSPAGSFSNGLCVIGQCKNSGMRNCRSEAYGYELFGASHSFMEGCKCYLGQFNNGGTVTPAGTLLVDGGSADISIVNNYIACNPAAPATNWIEVENSPIRVKVIGNTITGMPNGSQGISITDNNNSGPSVTDQNNRNVVALNTILGFGTASSSIGISMSSGVCVGNIIENVGLGMTGTGTAGMFIDGNVFINVSQGRFSNPEGDLQGQQYNWTERQSIGTKVLTSGSATPSVIGGGDYVVSQSGAQSITNFTGGLPGDVVNIFFYDAHTTIVHGSGINVAGGASVTPVANVVMTFKMFDIGGGNSWYEMSRTVSTTPAGDS